MRMHAHVRTDQSSGSNVFASAGALPSTTIRVFRGRTATRVLLGTVVAGPVDPAAPTAMAAFDYDQRASVPVSFPNGLFVESDGGSSVFFTAAQMSQLVSLNGRRRGLRMRMPAVAGR